MHKLCCGHLFLYARLFLSNYSGGQIEKDERVGTDRRARESVKT